MHSEDTNASSQPSPADSKTAQALDKLRHVNANLIAENISLHGLIATIPQGIQENNLDGTITYSNPAHHRILGYGPGELVGRKIWDMTISQEAATGLQNYLDYLLRKQPTPTPHTTRNRRKDGTIIDVRIDWSYRYAANGELTGFLSVITDISEQIRAENQLTEEKNKLEAMISALGDGLTIMDPDFKILFQNQAHISMQGDHLGERCYSAYRKRDTICDGCLLVQCFADGQVHRRETAAPGRNSMVHMEVSASPIKNAEGRIVAAIETVRDISAQKNLEAQLRQAQKMAAIATLAGGIAHDFNNILAAIIGYGELTRMVLPSELTKPHEYLNELMTASSRAQQLVKQILTFSRQQEQEAELIQPAPVIKEAMKLLRASIPTTIAISQHFDHTCGLIKIDPVQLHQIVMNLCTNSFQAMEETGGTLRVELTATTLTEGELAAHPECLPGEYLHLLVADTGPGIPPDLHERIFEPYFTTKEQGKGTGMGLAMVHGIVTAANGFIRVDSGPHTTGTSFHVYLPKEIETIVAPPLIQSPPAASHNERILYIDDEASLAALGQTILTRYGYQVTAMTDAGKALALFQTNPAAYDMVITDYTMPEMTGTALATALLAIRPDLPIILVTGYSRQIDKESARQHGIRAFANKPLLADEFSRLIRQVLEPTT